MARFFATFDYVVAPPHERSNWAMGLGLPIFITGPIIGPFSRLNRKLLVDTGVGVDIGRSDTADGLGSIVDRLRDQGRMKDMASAGWGEFDIHGFCKIVDLLRNSLS